MIYRVTIIKEYNGEITLKEGQTPIVDITLYRKLREGGHILVSDEEE